MNATAIRRCVVLTLLCAVGWVPAAGAHGVALPGSEHAQEHALLDAAQRRGEARWRALTPAQKSQRLRMERDRIKRAGKTARASAATDDVVGRWTGEVTQTPVVAVHSIVLPTGKVLIFSRDDPGVVNAASAILWDPVTKVSKEVPPPGKVNVWCGGQSLMADGRVLVAGGTLEANKQRGAKTVFTFDPWTENWAREPDMAHGRWYPTQTLLPDGRTLIVSGQNEDDYDPSDPNAKTTINQDVELFTPGAPGQGKITKLQSSGYKGEFKGFYPHSFVMPDGGVRTVGPYRFESWLMRAPDAAGVFSWIDRPDLSVYARKYSTAVLVPNGPNGSTRIMITGGYDDATPARTSIASAETVDEATPAAEPQASSPLNVERSHHNTVLLPDSSMVTIGGGDGNPLDTKGQWSAQEKHKQIELWNPATQKWTLGPAQIFKRAYHSTAFLLPDGRVVSAGDEFKEPIAKDYSKDQLEYYEPAYLFKGGERPVIDSMPGAVGYESPLRVDTRSTDVAKAVLVAPSAVTHANDMNQRLVPLRITAGANGSSINVLSPPNANIAPPGYYMLFLITASGKPSVAKWIRLGAGVPTAPAPVTPAPTPSAPPAASPPAATPPSVVTKGVQVTSTGSKFARVKFGSVRVLRGRELKTTATVPRASVVNFTVSVIRSGSRASQVLGRKRVSFSKAGRKTVTFKFSSTARRRLASKYARQLRVTASARDRAGHTAVTRVTLRLKR